MNITSDKCVFLGKVQGYDVYLAVYVDDALLMSESESAIMNVLNYLESNLKITLGRADEFLGFQIKRDRERRVLKISQSGYNDQVLKRFNMHEANFTSVPAEPGMFLQKYTPPIDPKIPYRKAIGSLLFAAQVSSGCRS